MSVLEMADGFVVDYNISPQERIKELRRAIRRTIPDGILEVERCLWEYFSPLKRESATISIGCYYPEQEYRQQGYQGLDCKNPDFLGCEELFTSMIVEQNLPKLGLRSATLEELIEFMKDDPYSALYGGFVAMGTS